MVLQNGIEDHLEYVRCFLKYYIIIYLLYKIEYIIYIFYLVILIDIYK